MLFFKKFSVKQSLNKHQQFSYEIFYFFILFVSFVLITWFIYKDFITEKFAFYFRDIGSDTVNSTLPNFLHSNYIKKTDGSFRTWSFFKGVGEALPYSWLINPLHILTLIWKFITGSKFWVYFYYSVLNFSILILIFSYLYFRTLDYSAETSLLFALMLTFSGYFVVGGTWGHSHVILKYIFLLFSFEQWLKKDRWIFLPIAVNFIAVNMFYLATGALFMLFYSLLRYYQDNQTFRGYIPLILKMVLVSIIGLLAGAINIFPQFHIMWNAPRVSGGSNLMRRLIEHPEQIDNYLRNITVIMRTFSSDLMGTGTNFRGWYNYLEAPLFYVGLLTLVLLPISFFITDKKNRVPFILLFILTILIAFVPIIRHSFNFFIGNYYKGAVDFFVPFFWVYISADTFENLRNDKRVDLLYWIITAGFLLVVLHFPYFKDKTLINFKLKLIISVFILLYILILNFIGNKSLAFVFLLITVVAELSYLSYISIKNRDKYLFTEIQRDMAGYNDGTFEALDYIRKQDTSYFYRIEKDYSSGNAMHSSLNDPMAQGYYGTTRYSSFAQKYYVRFLEQVGLIRKGDEAQSRWITGVRGFPLLMTFFSVKYFLAKDLNTKLRYSGYDSISTVKGIMILRNKYYIPLGFTLRHYMKEKDFASLSFFKKQQALLSAAILPNTAYNFNLPRLDTLNLVPIDKFNFSLYDTLIANISRVHLHITSFKNRRIEGDISVKQPSVMILTIPYDKGWQLEVNAKKYPYFLADEGFIGVYLPKGEYHILLEYFPPYFTLLKILTYLGIAIFLIFFGYRFIVYRKI